LVMTILVVIFRNCWLPEQKSQIMDMDMVAIKMDPRVLETIINSQKKVTLMVKLLVVTLMVKLVVVTWEVKKQSKKLKINIIVILVMHMVAAIHMVILTPTPSAQRVTIKKLMTVAKIIKFENTTQYY
jgi:hypothetical protein